MRHHIAQTLTRKRIPQFISCMGHDASLTVLQCSTGTWDSFCHGSNEKAAGYCPSELRHLFLQPNTNKVGVLLHGKKLYCNPAHQVEVELKRALHCLLPREFDSQLPEREIAVNIPLCRESSYEGLICRLSSYL